MKLNAGGREEEEMRRNGYVDFPVFASHFPLLNSCFSIIT